MLWLLWFRSLLMEILMIWQAKKYEMILPWHVSEKMKFTFWRELPKGGRGWKEDFSCDIALDFRVIFSSKLFSLYNYNSCHNYISKATFSKDNRHFQFELNQENVVHTALHFPCIHTFMKISQMPCRGSYFYLVNTYIKIYNCLNTKKIQTYYM